MRSLWGKTPSQFQMNGALVVDATGTPLRSATIWADQRATAEA